MEENLKGSGAVRGRGGCWSVAGEGAENCGPDGEQSGKTVEDIVAPDAGGEERAQKDNDGLADRAEPVNTEGCSLAGRREPFRDISDSHSKRGSGKPEKEPGEQQGIVSRRQWDRSGRECGC